MLIGVDGNEANIKNRVGSGQYTFELLEQFARISTSYSSSDPEFIEGESRSNVILEPLTRVILEPLTRVILKRSDRIFNSSPQVYTERIRSARTINHQFVVYLKDKPLADLPKTTKNFTYIVFGPKKFWTQFALPVKLTFGKKPDVFFSPAHYGPRFSPVPYVVTIHDLSYIHFPELFKKNDLYQLTNWTKYSAKNSAYIMVPSSSTKDDVVKNYSIKPSKITVTYEGYDQNRFKPQSKQAIEKIKKRYKIRGDYIIAVGTLQPRKNLERLIEAFASIVHSSQLTVYNSNNSVNREPSTQNLQLVIVGKRGWLYDEILEKSKKLGIKRQVIFTGFVPDEELPALISGASVYVNPSLWEGFGIPVIEAQACGVPVVVSNTSSLPEIVGDSAILVDPESVESIASGINKVLSRNQTRSDLVKKGFENTKRFSWKACAEETLKVLEVAA